MDDVAAFTSSTLYNVGFQFAFRTVTFGLNAILLRLVSRDLLGVANVRLMLLYTTLSFLIREPFRRAGVQRLSKSSSSNKIIPTNHRFSSPSKHSDDWTRFINVIWICPLLSLPWALIWGSIWIWCLTHPDPETVSYYTESVCIYALSIAIESFAEPLYVVGQQLRYVRLKVLIECIQVSLRSILVWYMLVAFPEWNLMAFAIAMVVSSSLYVLLYFAYFAYISSSWKGKEGFYFSDLMPNFSQGIDSEVWTLVRSFGTHSFMKQILTEGERYIMTFFNVLDFSDQGVYDVIHNLGSMVARFLFAPLEESAYNYFSLIIFRNKSAREQDPEQFPIATKVLSALLKLTVLVGLTICVFGANFSYVALHIYGGRILTSGSGPKLLRWYCMYVLLLAMNGITECFAFAAMSKTQVDSHKSFLFIPFVGFLTAAIFLSEMFGGIGFVWANCFNMALRICYSLKFIHRFYAEVPSVHPLRSLFPKLEVVIALVVSLFFTTLSNVIFCCDGVFNSVTHIAVGMLCVFAVVMTVHGTDKELVDFVEIFIVKKKLKMK